MRKIYEWERITDRGWIKLSAPEMTWFDKAYNNVFWQINNIARHIRTAKSIPKGIKRWWHLRQLCKKANKSLLKEAERTKSLGPAEPPSHEDVVKFINWAENSGINFENRVQQMPKTPLNSREVDITKD